MLEASLLGVQLQTQILCDLSGWITAKKLCQAGPLGEATFHPHVRFVAQSGNWRSLEGMKSRRQVPLGQLCFYTYI